MKKFSVLTLIIFISCGAESTTSTVADTTTTTVAKALSPFLDDEIIRVFPASDLQQETVDLTITTFTP